VACECDPPRRVRRFRAVIVERIGGAQSNLGPGVAHAATGIFVPSKEPVSIEETCRAPVGGHRLLLAATRHGLAGHSASQRGWSWAAALACDALCVLALPGGGCLAVCDFSECGVPTCCLAWAGRDSAGHGSRRARPAPQVGPATDSSQGGQKVSARPDCSVMSLAS